MRGDVYSHEDMKRMAPRCGLSRAILCALFANNIAGERVQVFDNGSAYLTAVVRGATPEQLRQLAEMVEPFVLVGVSLRWDCAPHDDMAPPRKRGGGFEFFVRSRRR